MFHPRYSSIFKNNNDDDDDIDDNNNNRVIALRHEPLDGYKLIQDSTLWMFVV